MGSTTDVRLEKEGYETLYASFSRNESADVGAIVGGLFFLFPFLWTMKYKPERTYELVPLEGATVDYYQEGSISTSTIQQLRELKSLLDEGVITEQEFAKKKKEILEGNN